MLRGNKTYLAMLGLALLVPDVALKFGPPAFAVSFLMLAIATVYVLAALHIERWCSDDDKLDFQLATNVVFRELLTVSAFSSITWAYGTMHFSCFS